MKNALHQYRRDIFQNGCDNNAAQKQIKKILADRLQNQVN